MFLFTRPYLPYLEQNSNPTDINCQNTDTQISKKLDNYNKYEEPILIFCVSIANYSYLTLS